MKKLTFAFVGIVIAIALPLAAKAQDEVIPGQHNFTGPLKPIADWAQGVANRSVNDVNDAMRDVDKKAGSGELDGVAVQKQTYDGRLATQKTIEGRLQEIQKKRDVVSQYIAAHPGDPQAIAIAKQLDTLYNAFADFGNKNSDKIALGRAFLEKQKVQDLPPVPNHIDKLPIPSAMPSGLEMQQQNDGNKPPVPSDADKPLGPPTLQEDLNASYKTEDNLNKLIPLAQRYAALTAQNAKDNPADPVLQADAENAQADLDKLLAMQQNNSTRITSDLEQKYPADDKKSASDAQNRPTSGVGDAINVIESLIDPPFGMWGGIVMASDQGDASTQQFIDAAIASNTVGVTVTQGQDTARDHARDSARDAADSARDAASAAGRDSARGSIDNCPPRGGCH